MEGARKAVNVQDSGLSASGLSTGDISNPNIRIVEAPLLDISSTVIRESFRQGRKLRYYTDGLFIVLLQKTYIAGQNNYTFNKRLTT